MRNNDDSTSELAWTGERYLPFVHGDIELEHLHRYAFAQNFANGKDVLDIACGEGYGSFVLAGMARTVIGVDISEEVIQHARSKYNRPNLSFKRGDCTNIPLRDGSVDIVVSFETIEHHNQHESMLSEIKRVLRPDGVLVISTPERDQMKEISQQRNEFHVKELSHREFTSLLAKYFTNSVFFGQNIRYGSLIIKMTKTQNEDAFSFYSGGYKSITRHLPLDPLFIIALASDIHLPISQTSFLDGSNFLRTQLAKATTDHDALVTEIARIKATASWRITKPLRFINFLSRKITKALR